MSSRPHEGHFSADDADDVRDFCALSEPDRRHVPKPLQIHDGAEVFDADGNSLGVLTVVPGIFGHAHRLKTGFFDEDNGDDAA